MFFFFKMNKVEGYIYKGQSFPPTQIRLEEIPPTQFGGKLCPYINIKLTKKIKKNKA
jgi:hypothetical protein